MTTPSNPTANQPEADLERILTVLRRRAVLIVACTLLTAVAAFGFSKQQTKEYTASASLVFKNGQLSQQVAGLAPVNGGETAAQQSTRVKLLELGPAAARTAKKLDHGITIGEVKSSVSISPQGESNVVDVSATTTSARRSAKIANAYAKQFVAAQANANRRYLAQARKLVEKQYSALSAEEQEEPQGLALLNRIQSLAILSSLRTGEAKLARSAAVPGGPSSPKVTRNTVLGALLGLLFGLSLAFLSERLNRRLREPEEAQEAFGLSLLGTVPESKAIMASNKGASAVELPFMENEAFRMLRSSLRYFNVDEDMRTILVTSYGAGVGKSTVAWNLARVAATGSRTVLVETDMRNPTIAAQHGLETGPGISEALTRQVGLDKAIQFKPIATDAGANGDGSAAPAMHVLTAGAQPPNPAELLESQVMEELLGQLRERYELVVIDTAPLGVVSDCFPLLRKVDGVVAVARMGRSTRDSVAQMRAQLDRLDAPALGIVANGLKLGRRARYGYGYYGTASRRSSRHPGKRAGAVRADSRSASTGRDAGPRARVERACSSCPSNLLVCSRENFAAAYDEQLWHVYGFFAYRIRCRAEAEDLTQQTFERALRAWATTIRAAPRSAPG